MYKYVSSNFQAWRKRRTHATFAVELYNFTGLLLPWLTVTPTHVVTNTHNETRVASLEKNVFLPCQNRGIRWLKDVVVDREGGRAGRLGTRECQRQSALLNVSVTGCCYSGRPEEVDGLGNRGGRFHHAGRPHHPARDWNPTLSLMSLFLHHHPDLSPKKKEKKKKISLVIDRK